MDPLRDGDIPYGDDWDDAANVARYTLLDFSPHMIARSRERLAGHPAAEFAQASFKAADWTTPVAGPFDGVVSMQAVHELRHTRHAPRLYAQVYDLLASPGRVFICDHTPFDDTPKSLAMYLPAEAHQRVLSAAGFTDVRVELTLDSLVLYAGRKGG